MSVIIEEIPPMETEGAKIKDDIALIAQKVIPLKPLLESEEVELTPAMVTHSAIVIAEEKIGSSKPMMVEDKGKGSAKIKEAKKAIEDDSPFGVGPFDQELGGRRYRALKNKSNVESGAAKREIVKLRFGKGGKEISIEESIKNIEK
ncbi:hypothetical protein ACJX0J_029485, partial [Zea mays]